MAKYVFDKDRGIMVDKETRLPMLNQEERARPVQAPRVFGDLPAYRSPIDGKLVDGRRARRYDMESNNCVDANDFIPEGGRKLKNKRFVEKHGLQKFAE